MAKTDGIVMAALLYVYYTIVLNKSPIPISLNDYYNIWITNYYGCSYKL